VRHGHIVRDTIEEKQQKKMRTLTPIDGYRLHDFTAIRDKILLLLLIMFLVDWAV
jgi:hypothetical protein